MKNRQLKTQRQKSMSDKVRLRRANSLAELFAPAEINAIIEELIGERENITDLVVFYGTGDNFYHSRGFVPKVRYQRHLWNKCLFCSKSPLIFIWWWANV